MKKFLCVVMSAVLLASSSVTVFSADNAVKQETPVASSSGSSYPFVLVRGMDFDGLYLDYGTDSQSGCIKSVSAASVLKALGKGAVNYIRERNLDVFTQSVLDVVSEAMGSLACDANGNSVYDVKSPSYDKSVAECSEILDNLDNYVGNEAGILHSAVDRYGADNVYYFVYDWRLDPQDTADNLNKLIETAKEEHNTDKVNLVCCSMGGIVTDSYIYEYGYDSLNKCVF